MRQSVTHNYFCFGKAEDAHIVILEMSSYGTFEVTRRNAEDNIRMEEGLMRIASNHSYVL